MHISNILVMCRYNFAVIATALVAVSATAWTGLESGTAASYSLLALLAFALRLSGGLSMGFAFVIFTLGRMSWQEALWMACAAQIIWTIARQRRLCGKKMLRALTSTILALGLAFASFAVLHRPGLQVPIDYMAAATLCLGAMHVYRWTREALWSYPYYLAVAAISVWRAPVELLPILLLLIWGACRLFERRLRRRSAATRAAIDLHGRVIDALTSAIDARDKPANSLSRRVPVYTREMALALDLPEREREALRVASLLYDVGELAVPEHILLKTACLTPEETEKIRIHPLVGAEILEKIDFPYPVAPIVLAHHERWDGQGYPQRMTGESIPIGARILAIADAVDALASTRHHRQALPLATAVEVVAAASGTAYDPQLVSLLQEHYRKWESLVPSDGLTPSVAIPIIKAQHETQMLNVLAAQLGASLDLPETFRQLEQALGNLVPFDTAAVWIEREGVVSAIRVFGGHATELASLRMPATAGVSGQALLSGQPILNGDPQLDLDALGQAAFPDPWRHALAVPLAAAGLHGVLTLYSTKPDPFTSEHARILGAVVPKVAAAVANGLKFQAVEKQAGIDGLTGLPNAGALESRMKQLESSCGVIVCDLDGFKRVNDLYGHMAGNRVLEQVAQGFRAACREGDFVARLGGDEFVLVVPGLTLENAPARLSSLQAMVRSVGRKVTGSGELDASFGVAFFPEEGKTAEELLSKADKRMYEHKSEHRSLHALAMAASLPALRQ